jgi:phosphoribosylamine--glycine ligase
VRGAQSVVYDTVNQISFDGMQYRRDIGYRAVNRKQSADKPADKH